MTNKARDFAIKWHGDQMYGDKPYVYHLDQVVANLPVFMRGDWEGDIAYLHDVLENTECGYEELAEAFGVFIADAVYTLTKQEGVSYDYYISAIKSRRISRIVKIADTKANLKQSILDNDKNRIVKYAKQLMLLEE